MLFQVSSVADINELSMANLQLVGMKAVETAAWCIFPLGVVSLAIGVLGTGIQTRFLFVFHSAAYRIVKGTP